MQKFVGVANGVEFTFVCRCENTRYGFRHLVDVFRGDNHLGTAKACYYNRTWESYTYQSVLGNGVDKFLKGDEKEIIYQMVKSGHWVR